MLFDDLTCSENEFQRAGKATEKARFQMNGALWAWVIKNEWKIDMKVLQKKEFDRQ